MIDKCNFFIYNKPTSIVYLHKLFISFSNFLAQGKISKTLDLFNFYIYYIQENDKIQNTELYDNYVESK